VLRGESNRYRVMFFFLCLFNLTFGPRAARLLERNQYKAQTPLKIAKNKIGLDTRYLSIHGHGHLSNV